MRRCEPTGSAAVPTNPRSSLLALVTFAVVAGSAPALVRAEPDATPLFGQGLAAREAWEGWIASLTGATRTGAEYWAGQRSLRNPGPCRPPPAQPDAGAWTAGCAEAKQRLAGSDALRKGEPEYRHGWNSYGARPAAEATAAQAAAASPASARPGAALGAPWYFVSTAQRRCNRVSDVFPKPGDRYPSTPEGIIAGTGGGSAYHMDRPAYGPEGSNLHPPGPVVRLTDTLGQWPTLVMVQGEAECQDALGLMLRAETEGSREQRWAAQNAARDAGWHVVFWDRRRGCVPLSEFIDGAEHPAIALEFIKEGDPDAYLQPVPDGAKAWERVIRTRGHNLFMVRNAGYCRIWHSMVRD